MGNKKKVQETGETMEVLELTQDLHGCKCIEDTKILISFLEVSLSSNFMGI